MSCIFYGYSSVLSLPDISKWNANIINNMSYKFCECLTLSPLLDISKWNINNSTKMNYKFSKYLTLSFLPDTSK